MACSKNYKKNEINNRIYNSEDLLTHKFETNFKSGKGNTRKYQSLGRTLQEFETTGAYEVIISKPDSALEIVLTYDDVNHMNGSLKNKFRNASKWNSEKCPMNGLLETLKVIGLL